MKLFGAGLLSEVNTFCNMPTTKKHFEECYLKRGGNHGKNPHYWAVPLTIFAERAQQNGWEYTESLCAGAMPAGPLLKKLYEEFRDEILADLKAAMPVNGVLLHLHGAMVAQSYDDCEGDLLQSIREVVGREIPIGAVLDPHTNLTQEMLDNCNLLIWLKEYPHTDIHDASHQLFDLMEQMLNKKISPTSAVADCHIISLFPTTLEPLKGFIDHIKALEKTDGVLSVSLVHGFPWGDVEAIGAKILVITNHDFKKAHQLAHELAKRLFQLRHQIMPKFYSIDEALQLAKQSERSPIVLADFADNVGGGALGDSTFILQAILKNKIDNVAVSSIWDPVATDVASSAGTGALIDLKIGGKMGPLSGESVDLQCMVEKIEPSLDIEFAGGRANYGTMVALRIKDTNIHVLINNVRCQTYSTDCFSKMGVDLLKKHILVVKSSEHFRTSFSKISSKIIMVAAPGALSPDFANIHYKKLNRPMWPINKDYRLQDNSSEIKTNSP